MIRPRRRAFVYVAGSLVACVVLIGVFALKDSIRESWYIPRLQSTELGERKDAAGALANMRSRKAIPHLVELFLDADAAESSGYALEALIRVGDDALSVLVERLRDAEWRSQALAVRTLRREGAPVEYSAELLRIALEHRQHEVRSEAMNATRGFGVTMAPLLLEALGAKNGDVRRAAARALGQMGRHALDSLIRLLADEQGLMRVRVSAAEALLELASNEPAARWALLRRFDDSQKYVRAKAVETLETLEVVPGGPHGGLRVKPASGSPGEEVTVELEASLQRGVGAFVLRLQLSEPVGTFVRTEVAGTTAARVPPSAIVARPDDVRGGWLTGVWFTTASDSQAARAGEDLPLIKVVLKLREDAAPGDYRLTIEQAHFVTDETRQLSVDAQVSGILTVAPRPVVAVPASVTSSSDPGSARPSPALERSVGSGATAVPAQFLFRAEDLRTRPGATETSLRFFATNSGEARSIAVGMRIDPMHVRIRKVQVEGTVLEKAGYERFVFQPHILDTGETVAACMNLRGGSLLLPGIDQHVLTVVVDVLPTAPEGTAVRVELGTFGDPPHECMFVIPPAVSQAALALDGTILIGESPVPEVRRVSAEVIGSGIRLRWENGGEYDSIRIERDGESLPGPSATETTYVDTSVGPGFHYYRISARKGTRESFPVGVAVRF